MNKLSTKHFMFFIFSTIVVSLRLYSSIFIKYGKRDTWIISLLGCILITLCYIYILNISRKTNTLCITDVFDGSYPKYISCFLLGIFCIGLFISSIESVSAYASSIHTNLFINTPIWYILVFLLIPACYILTRKFNSILIIVIVTSIIAIFGDIIYILLIMKYLNLSYILPIMEAGINVNSIKCFFLVLGSLSSVIITLPILSKLSSSKRLIKHSLIAIMLSCLIIEFSIFSLITFFGPTRAANIFYPEFIQSQRINIAHFIEFGEIFFIFRNVCMWFLKYLLSSYGIILILSKRQKISSKSNSIYLFTIIYNILILITGIFITKYQYKFFYYLEVFQYIFIFIFLLLPLITYTIYYIKQKKQLP